MIIYFRPFAADLHIYYIKERVRLVNKRDFYKELMSEYMFDKEKICANAKKGKLAGHKKPLPMYIGMTAAVAAAVVIVGTVAFTTLGKNNGAQITSEVSLAALNQNQRLERAIAEMQKNEGSEVKIDVYITFKTPLSPKETRDLLTQFSEGSVPVKMLVMTDGSRAMGTAEVGVVFKSNSGDVAAAVINCAGRRLAEINAHELVFLAESLSEKDDFAEIPPVSPDLSVPDTNTSVPDTSKPVERDPDTSGNNSTVEHPGIDDPISEDPGGVDDPNSGSSDSGPVNPDSGGSDDPGNSGSSGQPVVSDPDSSNNSGGSDQSSSTSDGNEEPPAVVPDLPDGVTLPYEVESPAFITDDIGAQRAYFLSEDVFYVKSENAVSLYKWDGGKETLAASRTISDAKVTWVSENGLRMMVSGVENGVRSKLFIIDANNCTINDMRVEEMVGEGSVAEAVYNEALDLFALNVLDDDVRYVYTAKLSGYQPSEPKIIAYGSKNLSLLGSHNNAVFYCEITTSSTVVYKYENDENLEVGTFEDMYIPSLNSAFTHSFVISSNGLSIFDPATESFIPIVADKVSFGASKHSFSDGKSYFTISGGTIVPESGISEIAKIDFTRSFSTSWTAAVSNGSVRIIPSIYTKRVKSDGIVFVQPAENASAAQRAVVNSSIGILNAIASGKCSECGFDTNEKLIAAIDACFTEGEARYIKASCGISETGVTNCNGSGLTVTNVSDTILVMDGELTGTLYIKVGIFNGMTAYRKVPVSLVNNAGRLMMDCIV